MYTKEPENITTLYKSCLTYIANNIEDVWTETTDFYISPVLGQFAVWTNKFIFQMYLAYAKTTTIMKFMYVCYFQEYDEQGRVIKKKKKGGKVSHSSRLQDFPLCFYNYRYINLY